MEILITVFEYIGIFAFAVSGAITAMKERLDLFGVYCVACISALGGGVLRDVVADNGVPAFFSSYPPVIMVIAAATLMLLMRERLRLGALFVLLDAAGLAVFVVSAGMRGIEAGYNFMLFIFVASITGVVGGILRDIVCNRKPDVFQRDIYTLAGIIGAGVLWVLYGRLGHITAMWLSMAVIIAIRMICYYFHVNLPSIKYRSPSVKP